MKDIVVQYSYRLLLSYAATHKKFYDQCMPSQFVSKIGLPKITYRAPSIAQSILKLSTCLLHQTNHHLSVFLHGILSLGVKLIRAARTYN